MAAASVVRPHRLLRAVVAVAAVATTALAGVLVAPAAPAHAAGVLDQQHDPTAAPTGSVTLNAWQQLTQTFTAGATGGLDAVGLHLTAIRYSGHVNVVISPIASPNLDLGFGTGFLGTGWSTVHLARDAPVVAGQQYLIRISSATSNAGVELTMPLGDGYAGGSSSHSSGLDIPFRTFVDASLSVPTITGDPSSLAYHVGFPAPAFTFGATGSPASTFSGWVPAGLQVTSSGALVGTPSVAGTFGFTVSATNGVGLPVYRSATITIRRAQPGPPTELVVGQSVAGSYVLTWTPPVDQGAVPVADYLVTIDGVQGVATTPRMEVSAAQLPIGVPVSISVTARSAAGSSTAATLTYTRTTVPDAPTGLTAVASAPGAVALAWAPPVQSGGTPTTAHEVRYRPIGGDDLSWRTQAAPSTPSAVVDGLTPGVTYEFQLASTNAVGTGAWSQSATARAIEAPIAPLFMSGVGRDGAFEVSWTTLVLQASPVTSTTVEVRAPGGDFVPVQTFPVATGSARIEGLVNGTVYQVRIVAANTVGSTVSGTLLAIPRTTPGAPTVTATIDGPGTVRIQVAIPSNGGSVVTQTRVERSVAGGGWELVVNPGPDASSFVTTQEPGVLVEYRASARNAVGWGPTGASTGIRAITTPVAPTSLEATGVQDAVELRWTSSASIAAPVDAWRVEQLAPGGEWQPTAATIEGTTAVVTGLEHAVPYDFRVVGVNAVGTGATSATASAAAFTTPGVPTGLVVTPDDRSVSLAWDAPADGGSAITAYVVERLVGDAWVEVDGVEWVDGGAVVGGLANGERVDLRVVAVNAAGAGAPSASVAATPRTVPDAPTSLVATPASSSVSLEWQAPDANGGAEITGYVVEQRRGDGDWTPAIAEVVGTTVIVSGLANGTEYELRVSAVNEAGTGASVQVFATPRRAPDAPTAVAATPGSESIAVTWEAPTFHGGSPIDDYVLQVHRWGDRDEAEQPIWVEPTAITFEGASAVVEGLVDGAMYSVRVAARNAAGTGAWSADASAMPRSVPGAPFDLLAFPMSGRVQLSWSGPLDDGGGDYVRTALQMRATDGEWAEPERVEIVDGIVTVLQLDDGTTYEFRVAIVTDAGQGPWSAPASATPTGLPTDVVGLTATPGDGRVLLEWDAPTWDGGTPIVEYVVLQTTPSGAWAFVEAEIDGTTAVVAELANGVESTFAVLARNANGVGPMGTPVTTTPFVFAPTLTASGGAALAGATLRPGDVVALQASQLPVGAEAVVELHSTPVELGRAAVAEGGDLSLLVTVPAGVAPGEHEIVVRLLGAGVAVAPIRIPVTVAEPIVAPPVAPPVVAPAPAVAAAPVVGATDGALPRTGTETLVPMLLLAFALLGAGVAVRRDAASRRRTVRARR